jgi:hypothetical protein
VSAYREQATFYRAALLLGLVRGERVIAWADTAIADDPSAPAAFADIAITPAGELTLLRQNLLLLASEKESPAVVGALIDLIHGDLMSGRRSFGDTMTVLKQLRAFVAVGASMNELLKTLGVDVAMNAPGGRERAAAEERVRAWLRQHEAHAQVFLAPGPGQ